MSKTSEIRFKVKVNEQNIPSDIKWDATDNNNEGLKDAKSIMLSIWDAFEKNTLAINLWTTEMTVEEMHAHYFQTLMVMTESYTRATNNPVAVERMQSFCEALSKEMAELEEQKNQ